MTAITCNKQDRKRTYLVTTQHRGVGTFAQDKVKENEAWEKAPATILQCLSITQRCYITGLNKKKQPAFLVASSVATSFCAQAIRMYNLKYLIGN